MNKFKTSREETQDQRLSRLAIVKSNDKLVKSYTSEELDKLCDKLISLNYKTRKILYDAYIDYLQLIGMTYDDACFYVDYHVTWNDLSVVNEVDGIEFNLLMKLHPEVIFTLSDNPALILSEVA